MSPKRLRLTDLDSGTFEAENSEAEVTEMAIPFVRGHYSTKDSGTVPISHPLQNSSIHNLLPIILHVDLTSSLDKWNS